MRKIWLIARLSCTIISSFHCHFHMFAVWGKSIAILFTSVLTLLFGKWGLVEKVGIAGPPVPLAAVQLYAVQTTHPPSFNLPLVSFTFGFVLVNIWFQIGICVCFAWLSCASVSSNLLRSLPIGFVFTQLSGSGSKLNFKIVKLYFLGILSAVWAAFVSNLTICIFCLQ